MKEKLELLGQCQVDSGQLYEWLKGNEEDVPLVFGLAEDKRGHLLSQWTDGVTLTTVNVFTWRMNVGALKTGSVVEKYNARWMRTDCMYCVRELETLADLFLLSAKL